MTRFFTDPCQITLRPAAQDTMDHGARSAGERPKNACGVVHSRLLAAQLWRVRCCAGTFFGGPAREDASGSVGLEGSGLLARHIYSSPPLYLKNRIETEHHRYGAKDLRHKGLARLSYPRKTGKPAEMGARQPDPGGSAPF